MLIKGVIFDMDGTLLDSMPLWDNMGSNYLKSKGIVPPPDANKKFKAISLAKICEIYHNEYNIPESPEKIQSEIDAIAEQGYHAAVLPKDGAVEFLEQLKKDGIKMFIATATDRYLVDDVLKRKGLYEYFDGIITCTEAGSGKDEPYIFYKCAEIMGTEISETAVFEDAIHAIKTARDAGFRVCGIYDASYTDVADSIEKLCHRYIHSFRELLGKPLDI